MNSYGSGCVHSLFYILPIVLAGETSEYRCFYGPLFLSYVSCLDPGE